ncbi:MAG: glycosyltransferase family 2 protein [Chryseolinea sp.]
MKYYPRISIVTPSFNDVRFLEAAITSLLDQQYPNLEYIVIDGGSTDGSVELIEKYSDKLAYWVSEKDEGMYHAISKGFERCSGEIMGWLNSDDRHYPGSLFAIAQLFSDIPAVQWLQGLPSVINETDRVLYAAPRKDINRFHFYERKYVGNKGFIQQESTFWTRNLWTMAGGYISRDFKLAGDFDLWVRFFKHANLYRAPVLLGAFRMSGEDQLSISRYDDYVKESFRSLETNSLSPSDQTKLKKYKTTMRIRRAINKWLDRIFPIGDTGIADDIKYDFKTGKYKIR